MKRIIGLVAVAVALGVVIGLSQRDSVSTPATVPFTRATTHPPLEPVEPPVHVPSEFERELAAKVEADQLIAAAERSPTAKRDAQRRTIVDTLNEMFDSMDVDAVAAEENGELLFVAEAGKCDRKVLADMKSTLVTLKVDLSVFKAIRCSKGHARLAIP